MSEPAAWLIRAGQRSRHARLFADHDVVALGWADVPGLGDLRVLASATIRERLEAAPHIASPEQDAAELLVFRDEIRVGDLVITPDAPAGEILVGEMTSGYDFRDPSPVGDYRHLLRSIGTVASTGISCRWSSAERLHGGAPSAGSATRTSGFAARVRDGEGRHVSTQGRASRTRPGAARAQAALAGRTCASCGLVKATSRYVVGDDRCIDCR